ncbi:MAG: sugar transferase [Lachnospiraceae bacterium]|nr:sugar transferase [Lachnospiraceae bacterium]
MYEKARKDWTKHIDFLILDLITMQIAYVLAYMTRHGWNLPYWQADYREIAIVMTLLDLCVMFMNRSYSGVLRRGLYREFKATVKHLSIFMATVLAYLFLRKTSDIFSREALVLLWVYSIVLSYLVRIGWKDHIRRYLDKRKVYRSVLLVTSSGWASEIVENIRQQCYRDYLVTALTIVDQDMVGQEILGLPIVAGSIDGSIDYLQSHVIDEVFINLPAEITLPEHCIDEIHDAGITVHINLLKLGEGENKVIEKFGGYTVLTTSLRVVNSRQAFLKRVLDIAGGVVGCILTLLMTIVIGPIIKIQSPGPIFFHQTRVGKNGRSFEIWKFRSMYPDAEARKQELMKQNNIPDGMMFKMKDDPRIFPFGHVIRKYSLDEFPQFYNVLIGDMSLVGTRPPTVDEFKKYKLHHRSRLSVKPGITGLWQVSGRNAVDQFEDVVRLDNEYINSWTIGKDLKIILKTVKIVVVGDGM